MLQAPESVLQGIFSPEVSIPSCRHNPFYLSILYKMVRRSSRRGVALAKAKALQSRMLLDAPDHKVLAGALPKVDEVLSAKLVKQKETRSLIKTSLI